MDLEAVFRLLLQLHQVLQFFACGSAHKASAEFVFGSESSCKMEFGTWRY